MRAADAFLALPVAAAVIMAPATPKKRRLLMFIFIPLVQSFHESMIILMSEYRLHAE